MTVYLRFPRGIPRGLIEACVRSGLDVASEPVFRGVFPAASLKLAHLETVAAGGARFSAGYSPRPH